MRAKLTHYYLENDFVKLTEQLGDKWPANVNASHLFHVMAYGKDEIEDDVVAELLDGHTVLNWNNICEVMDKFEDSGWRK